MPRARKRHSVNPPIARNAAQEALLVDFPAFCRITGLIAPWSPQPHDEMAAELVDMVPDFEGGRTQRKKIYLAPRGSYKTSLVIAFCIWLLLKYPQIKILLYRATRETSQQMLREIKGQLTTNPVILETFGDLSDGAAKWDEDSIIIATREIRPGDRDPTIMTIGVDGSTTGFHPDIAFLDDVVTEQNCDSIFLMEKAKKIMQSVYGLLRPYGTAIVTGTEWSSISLYRWILNTNKKVRDHNALLPPEQQINQPFEEYIRTVYITNPATGEQELFFPSVLSQEFIERQRNDPTLESRFFESWYFNRMVDPSAKPFKMSDLRFFDCLYTVFPYKSAKLTDEAYGGEEIDLFVAMVVDPTLTASSSSCAYGLSVCGFDANKNFLMLEARELIETATNADRVIFEMLLTYQPDVLVIESAGGDAGLVARIGAFIERMQLRTRVVPYSALQDEARGKRSKEARINAMEPFVTQGYMWMRRGFCNELVRQMDLYPSLVRNDVIDSWSMLRHARKFIPDTGEFERRRKDEGLEPDPYAVTYYDAVEGKDVTVDWETYHKNPLDRFARPQVGRGMETGYHQQRQPVIYSGRTSPSKGG